MRLLLHGMLTTLLLGGLAAADPDTPQKVEVRGTLKTNVRAPGGETTGTIVVTKDATYELDFGNNKDLRDRAASLSGKTVVVNGTLTVRKGVEVKTRSIVTVTSLKEGSAD